MYRVLYVLALNLCHRRSLSYRLGNISLDMIHLGVLILAADEQAGSIAHGEVGEGGLGPNYKSWWGV